MLKKYKDKPYYSKHGGKSKSGWYYEQRRRIRLNIAPKKRGRPKHLDNYTELDLADFASSKGWNEDSIDNKG